jgi:hypothetical protein
MVSDLIRLLGGYEHDDYKARLRWRDIFIVVLVAIPIAMYFIFGQAPVDMVRWGGMAQAWTLPIISIGTLYLYHRFMPKEMAATRLMTVVLWAGAAVITGFVLVSEFRRFMA